MEDLIFASEKHHFLGQAEIISILSPTQSKLEKLCPAQFWFSLGSIPGLACFVELLPAQKKGKNI